MSERVRYLIVESSPADPDRVIADWDGEVHQTRVSAEAELAVANGKDGCCDGKHWRLYAVVPADQWESTEAQAELRDRAAALRGVQ